jgi:ketosteroid isomerase-like protein
MSQQNVAVLYRWYEAFREHDNEACVRDSAADVEIVSYLLGVEGTVFKGHAGLRRYIDQVFAVFPDWHARVVRTIERGDAIVAEIRMAGRGAASGLEIEQTTWQATWFRDGKLARFTAYGDRAEALAAVRSAE